MAVYEYKGIDGAGKAVKGVIDAESPKSARAKLRRQSLFPTEIWEQVQGKATQGSGLNVQIDFSKYFQSVSPQDIATLTSQLSTLVGAGIPMVEALSALIEQVENPALKPVLVKIREDVNQGDALAVAMRKHPTVFNNLFVSMIGAGEASGALETVLKRLTSYTEATVRLRDKLRSAMMYPALMGLVSAGIVVGLFVGVIPKIRRIFESFDSALPLPTRVVLGISDGLQAYWLPLLLLIGGGVYGARRYLATPKGRRKWHEWQLRLPIFGKISRMVAVSRFCRTMSTLLDSGVPILTAVSIVKAVVDNDIIAEAVENAGKNIREGQSIAIPLKESGQFPPLVTHMIAIGEKTGDLEPMLSKVADAYDEQVENMVGALTSLLEPLMILTMGGVVTLVALSILLPMMEMSSMAR
ncbi:MAG: type II secretion system inner membrane protein GspF [Deltaproteobacteria bacterium]|jgi:general secretion pathway protein F|nr:type II secretion system inner membrane protein GspF [Deltaproteobacteria bacterium]